MMGLVAGSGGLAPTPVAEAVGSRKDKFTLQIKTAEVAMAMAIS